MAAGKDCPLPWSDVLSKLGHSELFLIPTSNAPVTFINMILLHLWSCWHLKTVFRHMRHKPNPRLYNSLKYHSYDVSNISIVQLISYTSVADKHVNSITEWDFFQLISFSCDLKICFGHLFWALKFYCAVQTGVLIKWHLFCAWCAYLIVDKRPGFPRRILKECLGGPIFHRQPEDFRP